MSFDYEDIKRWSMLRYAENERPLHKVVEMLKKDTKAFRLLSLKTFPNNVVMWDPKTKAAVVVTYAFVVRSATPPDTGNFVPPGEDSPPGIINAKSEPGTGVVTSVVADCSFDPVFRMYLSAIEEWALTQPLVGGVTKNRGDWMDPNAVAQHNKYVMASPVFGLKTAFTASERVSMRYKLHPWIQEAVKGSKDTWIPSPVRAITAEKNKEGKLVEIQETDRPRLEEGDVIRTAGKIFFTVTQTNFSMAISPVQHIRVERGDGETFAVHGLAKDNDVLGLTKLGEPLKALSDEEEFGSGESDGEMRDIDNNGRGRSGDPGGVETSSSEHLETRKGAKGYDPALQYDTNYEPDSTTSADADSADAGSGDSTLESSSERDSLAHGQETVTGENRARKVDSSHDRRESGTGREGVVDTKSEGTAIGTKRKAEDEQEKRKRTKVRK